MREDSMNDLQRDAVEGRFEEAKLAAKHFYKLVKNKLPRRLSARIDHEDVEGEALLVVSSCYADARMDARPFLRTVVYNHLRKWLKAELSRFDDEINLSTLLADITPGAEEPGFMQDRRPFANPADRVAHEEFMPVLLGEVDSLPARQRDAVRGLMNGKTVRQLSGEMGVGKSMAHQHRQAGLSTLRTYCGVA